MLLNIVCALRIADRLHEQSLPPSKLAQSVGNINLTKEYQCNGTQFRDCRNETKCVIEKKRLSQKAFR